MKIFRPILQTYNKIFVAFLRKQRNTVPVIVKQIAAINRRKPDYSGYFGTPEGNRTPSLTLRRGALYPIELLAHMQFLFVSVTPAVENPPNVRRRTLYPGEVRGHEPKYFTPFVRACQLRKTAHASCAEASHQKPPPSWTPGGGAEHRRRAAYPFRRLCYTISWDNWEEGFVKKHNFRQSHQIYYLYLQHKSSKIFRINAYHNALCILFFLPKKLFQNQLCPRRPDRKTKSPSAKADGLWWGRVDSNHRRHCQQIYSLSPLATREHPRVRFTQRGAGGRTRTPDLLITNQLLYRLSYTSAIPATAIIAKQQPFVNKNFRPAPIFFIQATVPALSSYFS